MRRFVALMAVAAMVAACRTPPDPTTESTVIQLPQSHFNVALAVARTLDDAFFLETADVISRAYERAGEPERIREIGSLVRTTLADQAALDLTDALTALTVSNRASLSSADERAFEEIVVRRIVSEGTARDMAALFGAAVIAAEPNPDLLRTVLDTVYTLPIGDERTMALVTIAETIVANADITGLNAVVQQTIPSLRSGADPVRRFAAYAATASNLLLMDDTADVAGYVARGTEGALQSGTLRVPARDAAIYLRALENFVAVGALTEAELVVDRTEPARSRAAGYLRLAATSERAEFVERAYLAAQGVEDAAARLDLLGRVAIAFAEYRDRDGVLRVVDALERIDGDYARWPAGFVALLLVSERPWVERYLAESVFRPDLARVTGVLGAALDDGYVALAEQIYTFARTSGVAGVDGEYVYQLARMGKSREVLAAVGSVPYSPDETGRRLLVRTLRVLPPTLVPDDEAKEALAHAFGLVRGET